MARKLFAAIAVLGLAGLTGPAFAGTDSLVEGVYYNSPNNSLDNFAWTVAGTYDDQNNTGLELGLQGLIRYTSPVTPVGSIYTVSTGTTQVPGESGSLWGYAFSAYDPQGLSGLTFSLTVTDVATGLSISYDPSAISDDGTDGANGFQNAENLSFTFTDPDGGAYNPWVADTYLITLTATGSDGAPVASDAITVNAVPEPVSMSILGAGLVGMVVARRRAKKARC